MLPPFRLYSGRELLEVLLRQGMGLVGWPVGLVGGLANLLLHRAGTDLVSLLLLAMYPVMLLGTPGNCLSVVGRVTRRGGFPREFAT